MKVGDYVEHAGHPEWGPGKVVHSRGTLVFVFFRDLAEQRAKKFRSDGLVRSGVTSDSLLDNLPPIIEKDGEILLPNERLTVQQARTRFLNRYPRGFIDPEYIGTAKQGERTYKWNAHERLVAEIDSQEGRDLLRRGDIAPLVQRLKRAIGSARDLMAPTEAIAFGEGMDDEGAAARYLTTLYELLDAGPVESAFTRHAEAVGSLPAKGASHTDKWPIATIAPYLIRPDIFVFVKPEITKAAAAALAFDISYETRPNWKTYHAVLRMSRIYMEKLADLGARDFIDIQSFFWVTGGTFAEAVARRQAKQKA